MLSMHTDEPQEQNGPSMQLNTFTWCTAEHCALNIIQNTV